MPWRGGASSTLPLAVRADTRIPISMSAIIGGGVAGTYMTRRITGEQPRLRVALFEMSDRIGGRLRLPLRSGRRREGRKAGTATPFPAAETVRRNVIGKCSSYPDLSVGLVETLSQPLLCTSRRQVVSRDHWR